MDQLKVLESYTRLTAMRQHLPGRITPRLADEYHAIVDELEEQSGAALEGFRIPAEAIHSAQRHQSHSDFDGTPYSTVVEAYVEREAFLIKLDAILPFFQLLTAAGTPGKTPIGFRPPKSDDSED